MSTDTVNFALSKTRLSILQHPEHFSRTGQQTLLALCGCMRDYLMSEDSDGFNQYIDSRLASEPDAMVYVLDDLYEELGFGSETGTREMLNTALAA